MGIANGPGKSGKQELAMANTETNRDMRERDRMDTRDDLNYRDRDYRDRDRDWDRDNDNRNRDRDRPHVRMLTSTEARRSFVTTEFWLALIAAAAVITAGYVDNGKLLVSQGWALGCGIIAFYLLSRGIAKAGSHEPKLRDLD
jgi:hypothetical protein